MIVFIYQFINSACIYSERERLSWKYLKINQILNKSQESKIIGIFYFDVNHNEIKIIFAINQFQTIPFTFMEKIRKKN